MAWKAYELIAEGEIIPSWQCTWGLGKRKTLVCWYHITRVKRNSESKEVKGSWITESQNHRMIGVGRDLCGSSSPTLLLKQGHLQQAAQELVQAGLQYLQRRRLHNLRGQPVPVLCHPQREEVLPHVQTELPLLQFVPIAPCPVAGHYWKEPGPILLALTLQIFLGISKVPSQPPLLQAEQGQLPQPLLVGEMLQSPHHPHSPPLDSVQ